jgi:hypothetical protein
MWRYNEKHTDGEKKLLYITHTRCGDWEVRVKRRTMDTLQHHDDYPYKKEHDNESDNAKLSDHIFLCDPVYRERDPNARRPGNP